MATELMRNGNENGGAETRDTLILLSGVAFVVFGAGLILSTPVVRRYLGGMGVGSLLQVAVPDLEKYMRLKSM